MTGEVYRYWPYAQTCQRAGVAAVMPPNFPVNVPPTQGIPALAQYREPAPYFNYEVPGQPLAALIDSAAQGVRVQPNPLQIPATRPNTFPYDPPNPVTSLIIFSQGAGTAPSDIPRVVRYNMRPPDPLPQTFRGIAHLLAPAQGAGDQIPPTPVPYPSRERPFLYALPPPNTLASVLSPGVMLFAARYSFDWDPVWPGRRWRLIYTGGRVAGFTGVVADGAPVVPDVPPPLTPLPPAAMLRREDGRQAYKGPGNLVFLPVLQGAGDVVPPTALTRVPARLPDSVAFQPRSLLAALPQSQGSADTPPYETGPFEVARESWRPVGPWQPGPGWLASIEDTELVPGPDQPAAVAVYERPRYPRIEPIRAGIAVLIPQPQGSGNIPGPFSIARYDLRIEPRATVPPPFFTQGTPPIAAAPPGPLVIARYPPPPDVRTRYTQVFVLQPGLAPLDAPPGAPPIARVPPVTDARARYGAPPPTIAWLAPQAVGIVPPTKVQYPQPPPRPMPQTFVRIAAYFSDITAPTVPVQDAPTVISDTQVDVNWEVSTDSGSGLAGYFIYINGARVTVFPVTGVLFHATGLAPGTTYAFQVSAVDKAGNESGRSNIQFATTTGGATGGLIFTRRRWKRRF